MSFEKLYEYKEVNMITGIPIGTLRNYVWQKKFIIGIDYIKHGRKVKFKQSTVERIMEKGI